MDKQPTISTPEAVIMLLIVGFVDLFEFIATFIEPIPVIGLFFTFAKIFTNFVTLAGIQFWLIMKGEKSLWFLGGGLIETAGVSFLNWLPLKTAAVATVIIKSRSKMLGTLIDATSSPQGALRAVGSFAQGAGYAAMGRVAGIKDETVGSVRKEAYTET